MKTKTKALLGTAGIVPTIITVQKITSAIKRKAEKKAKEKEEKAKVVEKAKTLKEIVDATSGQIDRAYRLAPIWAPNDMSNDSNRQYVKDMIYDIQTLQCIVKHINYCVSAKYLDELEQIEKFTSDLLNEIDDCDVSSISKSKFQNYLCNKSVDMLKLKNQTMKIFKNILEENPQLIQ